MINIQGELPVTDRWNFRIRKIEADQDVSTFVEGTDYVMAVNSTFYREDLSFTADNFAACQSDRYSILTHGNGSAVIISFPGLRLNENRYYTQRILDQGNLSYIDGGTNTTAINPGRLGDPVINYVHFPARMYQTLHTHPSHRVGMVLRGAGRVELDHGEFFPVREGEAFFLRRNELHNFITDDEPVILYVWAPDSGTGPTDEVNPLKIRTYVGQQRFSR
jgi:mannose-6-phosphate isomerase-like protein (cupin superfamily)